MLSFWIPVLRSRNVEYRNSATIIWRWNRIVNNNRELISATDSNLSTVSATIWWWHQFGNDVDDIRFRWRHGFLNEHNGFIRRRHAIDNDIRKFTPILEPLVINDIDLLRHTTENLETKINMTQKRIEILMVVNNNNFLSFIWLTCDLFLTQ